MANENSTMTEDQKTLLALYECLKLHDVPEDKWGPFFAWAAGVEIHHATEGKKPQTELGLSILKYQMELSANGK